MCVRVCVCARARRVCVRAHACVYDIVFVELRYMFLYTRERQKDIEMYICRAVIWTTRVLRVNSRLLCCGLLVPLLLLFLFLFLFLLVLPLWWHFSEF